MLYYGHGVLLEMLCFFSFFCLFAPYISFGIAAEVHLGSYLTIIYYSTWLWEIEISHSVIRSYRSATILQCIPGLMSMLCHIIDVTNKCCPVRFPLHSKAPKLSHSSNCVLTWLGALITPHYVSWVWDIPFRANKPARLYMLLNDGFASHKT